ncbi:response regulator [Methylobrevis albus]|uniref:Response regulator transcription factor n=1 Tax=Methylobrevis albus TaxID=2793297 RepID=A0A931I4S4_9HYPH|nr:response regulator transcription factor [Methylobrevis albus]MBH0239251.1 response regulator transcription factor [Methylobrevis albus]
MIEATILLVDDHPVVREGYRRLLERRRGFRVVAEAETAAEAYQRYRDAKPAIVVMDITMPGASGIEALRHIRQYDRDARVLIFSMHQGAAFALKAFEAGAAGYVTKSSAPDELVRAVETVLAGRRAMSEDVAREIATERLSQQRSELDGLSPRETEILRLVASGRAADEIAATLNLSPKTVQNYHYQIKAKVGARTDADLVWLAIETGLLRADERGRG